MNRILPLAALVVLLAAPSAIAHPEDPSTVEPIGEATVTVTYNGPDRPVSFEIELARQGTNVTDGELFTELIDNTTGQLIERQALYPDQDGRYRLHVPLEPGTTWTIRFYHGYGFDVADAIATGGPVPSDDQGTERTTEPLYAFHPDTPDRLNLWGYSAYGVLLAIALVGVGAIVHRIDQADLSP